MLVIYKWHIRVLAEMYWFEFTTKTYFNILIYFISIEISSKAKTSSPQIMDEDFLIFKFI